MNVHKKHYYPYIVASIILMLGVPVGIKNITTPNEQASTITKHSETTRAERYIQAMTNPYVISVSKTSKGVQYLFSNGNIMVRSGGSIAWRNNNPGCIRYSSKSVAMGAIGTANKFAIFPDEETGMQAIKTLLLSESYRNLSVAEAIHQYAPPHENDTERYIRSLCNIVGVHKTTKLSEMDDEQIDYVVKTIRKLEGWIVGTETFTPLAKRDSRITDIKQFAIKQKAERTI